MIGNPKGKAKHRHRLDEKQVAVLTTYFNKGMKGVGKQYALMIWCAASEGSLTPQQVMMSDSLIIRRGG